MLESVKEVEGSLNIKVLDLEGNIVKELNECNFMTDTYRKMLLQSGLGGFIGAYLYPLTILLIVHPL